MPRVAFLFPGQGSQAIGMGKISVEASPAARKLFDEAAGLLGYDLLNLCLNGPIERLNATNISQPAIFVSSLAALEVLRQTEPAAITDCIATAGLSLGEYTSLVFAGAMSFQEGLKVVQQRGEAMQAASEATPGGMAAVIGADVAKVEEIVQISRSAGLIQIANYLCPGNIVVSGTKAAIDEVEKVAKEKGAPTARLQVAGAFHTELMKPADEKLAVVLAGVSLQSPRVPVWSNVDAKPHTDPAEIRGLLVRQVLNPVRWEESIRGLLSAGVERFFEIGPGRVLAGLLKRVDRKIECKNIPA